MSPMEHFDASKADFHSLRVLVLVFDLGSLTEAARAMNLGQSSLSYTLGRMRVMLGDPLFVQEGRRLVPTSGCTALMPQVRRLLDDFHALLQPRRFDPASSDRVIRLCCNYYERETLLPALVDHIRSAGPGLRLEVSTADTDGHRQLLEGKADVLLSPVVADQSGLMVRTLFEEHYVCLMHADDPRREGLDLEAYRQAEHIVVTYDRGWRPFYLETLKRLGIQIDPIIALPSYGALGALMRRGGYLVTLPSRLAQHVAPDCVSVPAPFDAHFSLKLFWPERDHADPYSVWLRDRVGQAVASAIGTG